MQNNLVAIVGRPNVGKSTLFNRLVGTRKAIMDNQSGVTRDRHYGQAEWIGKHFFVVDTGGYVVGSEDTFEQAIRSQVELALEEAKAAIFMIDVETGITELDKEFAAVIRRYNKPVLIAANKADTHEKANYIGEFYALGFDKIYPISSQTGSGTGELLDELVQHLDESGEENPYERLPRIAVLGRPNVGKSSFVNALLGTDRNIVTDIAGTTRDAIDSVYNAFGHEFLLTDTAGIRRKSKLRDDNVEFYSVLRSLKAMENSDVCIVMLDATRGLESQDLHIIGMVDKLKKGMIILVNKWDLVEKETNTAKLFEKMIYEKIAPISYPPVIFVSALTKQRIFKAVEKAIEVYENRKTRIPTSVLNEKLLPEIENFPPPSVKGKLIKIKYISQIPTHTPSFAFYCNLPQYIKEPYARFLENKMREYFNLEGVGINIFFRKK
jgi:GTP-binding protein